MTSISPRSGAARITIERASIADAEELARTGAAMFEATFGEANTPEDMAAYLAGAFSAARQRRDIGDARNRIWLARDERQVLVGYAHVRFGAAPPAAVPHTRPAEIVRLYADSNFHGRGLGAALMGTCIESARQEDADLLWLGVWEHNERAIAFYTKNGFKAIGEQTFMLGSDRQRDVVMALALTPIEP